MPGPRININMEFSKIILHPSQNTKSLAFVKEDKKKKSKTKETMDNTHGACIFKSKTQMEETRELGTSISNCKTAKEYRFLRISKRWKRKVYVGKFYVWALNMMDRNMGFFLFFFWQSRRDIGPSLKLMVQ